MHGEVWLSIHQYQTRENAGALIVVYALKEPAMRPQVTDRMITK